MTANSNKIIVDINVGNCHIMAARPEMQIPMPCNDVGRVLFWNTCPMDRLNKRQFGSLKGRALRKAESAGRTFHR